MKKQLMILVALGVLNAGIAAAHTGGGHHWHTSISCDSPQFNGDYVIDNGVYVGEPGSFSVNGGQCSKVRKCSNTVRNENSWSQQLTISGQPVDYTVQRVEVIQIDITKSELLPIMNQNTYDTSLHSDAQELPLRQEDLPGLDIEDSPQGVEILQDKLKTAVENAADRINDSSTVETGYLRRGSSEDVLRVNTTAYSFGDLSTDEVASALNGSIYATDGGDQAMLETNLTAEHIVDLSGITDGPDGVTELKARMHDSVTAWQEDYNATYNVTTSYTSTSTDKDIVRIYNKTSDTERTIHVNYQDAWLALEDEVVSEQTELYYFGYEEMWQVLFGEYVESTTQKLVQGEKSEETTTTHDYSFDTAGTFYVKNEKGQQVQAKVLDPKISIAGAESTTLIFDEAVAQGERNYQFTYDLTGAGTGEAKISSVTADCPSQWSCSASVDDNRLPEDDSTQAQLTISDLPDRFTSEPKQVTFTVEYTDGYSGIDMEAGTAEIVTDVTIDDRVDPETTVEDVSGSQISGWYQDTASVTFACTDLGYGCQSTSYCAGTGTCNDFTTAEDGQATVSGDGNVNLRYRSLDQGNNQEAIAERVLQIDSEAPSVSCDGESCAPNEAPTDTGVAISPETSDSGIGTAQVTVCADSSCSNILCSYDPSETSECEIQTPSNPDSNYEFWIRAQDGVGHSVIVKGGSFGVKNEIGNYCTADNQCLSGNCQENACQPQQEPPIIDIG